MAYARVLETLGRLQIDPRFRAAFLAGGPGALGPVDLTDEERAALLQLDRAGLIRLCRMFDAHRLARIKEHVGWADPAARPGLGALLEEYFSAVPPKLLNRDEALSFCRWLEDTGPAEPPYLAELARCDRLRIEIAWGLRSGPHLEELAYPIPRILEALGEPGWPESAPERTRLEIKKVPATPAALLRWS